VLKGDKSGITLRMPRVDIPEPGPKPSAWTGMAVEGPEPDPRLFASLKALRTDLARRDGVPPYVVFTDRALTEMAAYRPTTPGQLGEVHGVGPAKLARYGEAFLKAIREQGGKR
jgi:ATP-dependent DNA helicase RecQ